MKRVVMGQLLALLGAVAGGAIGYLAFGWLTSQGYYGLAIPGALLGLGCGWLAQDQSRARGVLCAVAALGLSIYAEWRFFTPLDEDGRPRSLAYLATHLHEREAVTLIMIAMAVLIAYWTGQDSGIRLLPRDQPPASGDVPSKGAKG